MCRSLLPNWLIIPAAGLDAALLPCFGAAALAAAPSSAAFCLPPLPFAEEPAAVAFAVLAGIFCNAGTNADVCTAQKASRQVNRIGKCGTMNIYVPA